MQEITRRVNQHDIWQAVYTAGLLLPKPVAECQYWHRSLNPKKLIGVGFRCGCAPRCRCSPSQEPWAGGVPPPVRPLKPRCPRLPPPLARLLCSRLAPRMTMARTLKLYKLPDVPQTPGLRQMEAKDVPQVTCSWLPARCARRAASAAAAQPRLQRTRAPAAFTAARNRRSR